jgi:DNA-binding CsgD family transcriptional regulator
LVARSWIALLRGDFEGARSLADEARALGHRGNPTIVAFTHLVHAWHLSYLTGDPESNLDAIDAFVRQHPVMALPMSIIRVVELSSMSRRAEASVELRHFAAIGPSRLRPILAWLPGVTSAAEAAVAAGDTALAATLYDALLPYAAYNVVTGAGIGACNGSVCRYLGDLATTLRRWSDAAEHYEAAIAFDDRMGALPYVVCSKVQYAELLMQRRGVGDLHRARQLARDGQAIAQELGMLPWLNRAMAVLRSVDAAGVADHPLSRREIGVAALVAEGLSNRAMAERLHLSERTVESHVKNICDKLGFNSRSQVAAWVAARTPDS